MSATRGRPKSPPILLKDNGYTQMQEIVLFMDIKQSGYRATANRIMLASRAEFIMNNERDILPKEWNLILANHAAHSSRI